MKNHAIKWVWCFILALFAILSMPVLAFADCNSLANNQEWMDNMVTMRSQIESNDYNAAIETSKKLFAICQESPVLLYYTGTALRGTGDEARAKIYFQKASEATDKMSVELSISRKIWFARYECEYPERTEKAIQAMVDEKEAQIAEKSAQAAEYKAQAEQYLAELEQKREENNQLALQLNDAQHAMRVSEIVMWTGTGAGIAGLALIGASIPLILGDKSNAKVAKAEENIHIKGSYIGGWTCLGLGIGMTALGTVMAGIGGFYYTHSGNAISLGDDAELSFQVAPRNIGMTLNF